MTAKALIRFAALALILLPIAGWILAAADDAKSPLTEAIGKITGDFQKAVQEADARYEKQLAPIAQRRALAVETAGKDAIARLQKVAREAKQMGSELGDNVVKAEIENVTKAVDEAKAKAPGALDESGAAVLGATYGAEGTWVDVTKQVQTLVKANSPFVPESAFKDPIFGVHKTLIACCLYKGKYRMIIVPQAETFTFAQRP